MQLESPMKMTNIFYTVMHALLSIFIPTTNIMVIVVLSKLLKKSKGKSYVFILNLAAADLLVGLMCIVETLDDLYDGDFDNNLFFCLLRLCMTITPCVGSMLTLLLISLDRYLAVMWPLYYLRIMSTKSVIVLLVVLWIIAFFVGHVPLIYPSLQQNNYPGNCGLFYAAKSDYLYILCFSVFLPSLITSICLHITVGRVAYSHHQRIRRTWVRNSPMNMYPPSSSQFKAIRTVLIVIVCFTLSWGPYYMVGLVQASCSSCDFTDILKDLLFLLGETNSLLNPLIYAFYCRDIRRHLSKCVCCKRRKVRASDLAIVHFTNLRHPKCLKNHLSVTDCSQRQIATITFVNTSSGFSVPSL